MGRLLKDSIDFGRSAKSSGGYKAPTDQAARGGHDPRGGPLEKI